MMWICACGCMYMGVWQSLSLGVGIGLFLTSQSIFLIDPCNEIQFQLLFFFFFFHFSFVLSGFSGHGIFQARIVKWGTISSSRGSPGSSDQTCLSFVSCFGRRIFLALAPPGEPKIKYGKGAQLCLALCNPLDYSPAGSSVYGIFQARILA